LKIELMVLKKSNNHGSQENQQTSQRTCPLLQWEILNYTPDPLHVHSFEGAFTLGVRDSSVESPNTMLVN
jgi:hypothetical protein